MFWEIYAKQPPNLSSNPEFLRLGKPLIRFDHYFWSLTPMSTFDLFLRFCQVLLRKGWKMSMRSESCDVMGRCFVRFKIKKKLSSKPSKTHGKWKTHDVDGITTVKKLKSELVTNCTGREFFACVYLCRMKYLSCWPMWREMWFMWHMSGNSLLCDIRIEANLPGSSFQWCVGTLRKQAMGFDFSDN